MLASEQKYVAAAGALVGVHRKTELGTRLQGCDFVRAEDVPFCSSPEPLGPAELAAAQLDPAFTAVVQAFHRPFSYRHLCFTIALLTERPDCLYVATNADSCDRLSSGRIQAGTGCWIAAVQTGSGVKPVRGTCVRSCEEGNGLLGIGRMVVVATSVPALRPHCAW